MNRSWLVVAGLALPIAALAFEGHWEGVIEIPGAPMRIAIDLQPDAARGWVGSFTLPGRGVKGRELAPLVASGRALELGLGAAFAVARAEDGAVLGVEPRSDGVLAGRFRQGGHEAPVVLRRTGAAQVDHPPVALPLDPALTGHWRGRYELGGYEREVTLTLQAGENGRDSGELVIVGRRRSVLAVDRVERRGTWLTLESTAAAVRIEGRLEGGAPGTRLAGHFVQGPFEAPLVLQREEPRP